MVLEIDNTSYFQLTTGSISIALLASAGGLCNLGILVKVPAICREDICYCVIACLCFLPCDHS